MKQTAVEWYCNEMESLRVNAEINNMDAYKFIIRRAEIFEQAKEMEKEQIINSREDGFLWGMRNTNNFYADKVIESEQYYNETFKSE